MTGAMRMEMDDALSAAVYSAVRRALADHDAERRAERDALPQCEGDALPQCEGDAVKTGGRCRLKAHPNHLPYCWLHRHQGRQRARERAA